MTTLAGRWRWLAMRLVWLTRYAGAHATKLRRVVVVVRWGGVPTFPQLHHYPPLSPHYLVSLWVLWPAPPNPSHVPLVQIFAAVRWPAGLRSGRLRYCWHGVPFIAVPASPDSTIVAKRNSDRVRVAGVPAHCRSNLNNLATRFHLRFCVHSLSPVDYHIGRPLALPDCCAALHLCCVTMFAGLAFTLCGV